MDVEPQEARVTAKIVAAMIGVDVKTVARWARAGKIPSIRTVGGHRRYLLSEVLEILPKERRAKEPGEE